MYLSLYCKGSKKVTQGFTVRGSWRPNRTAIYWPPLLWSSTLCLSRSPGLLNRRPRAHSAGFLYYILSATSLDPYSIGGPEGPFGLVWLSLPHLVSTPTVWLFVLTELYINSTSTQSPTQSLEWHVWSSSSGNNCHAVQRSLSSGVSVYECIMGFFTSSHFVSQFPPTRFPLITAIGMCHFLPVHHLGMASLPGRRSKYNTRLMSLVGLI